MCIERQVELDMINLRLRAGKVRSSLRAREAELNTMSGAPIVVRTALTVNYLYLSHYSLPLSRTHSLTHTSTLSQTNGKTGLAGKLAW